MRERPNKNPGLFRFIQRFSCFIAVFLIVFSGQAFAAMPYFESTGGDVATGAWFNNDINQTSCTGSGFYQAPDYANQNYKIGGILSFATPGVTRKGANSQYAAYSLGLIEYNPAAGNNYGFFTGNQFPGRSFNTLSFANYFNPAPAGSTFNNGGSGGLFEGAAGHYNWHCIPDYYDDYVGNTPYSLGGTSSVDLNSLNQPSGTVYQDTINPSILTVSSSAPIAAGKNINLYIDGDVYISSNISYGSHDATNIPRFALVVKGNIYVAPGVTQLDGIYVAQPTTGNETTTGQFWTCHPNSTTAFTLAQLVGNCSSLLTINGSVTAAGAQLTRVNNGLVLTGLGMQDNGPAEIFNYTPETAIGGSFNPPSGSPLPSGKIDSLVSLPPVF